MLLVLSKALDLFCAISDVFEAAFDFARWRDDWNQTSSPVSFFLAVMACLVLVALACFYGAAAWAAVRSAFL